MKKNKETFNNKNCVTLVDCSLLIVDVGLILLMGLKKCCKECSQGGK
jgi:hypothetical protein